MSFRLMIWNFLLVLYHTGPNESIKQCKYLYTMYIQAYMLCMCLHFMMVQCCFSPFGTWLNCVTQFYGYKVSQLYKSGITVLYTVHNHKRYIKNLDRLLHKICCTDRVTLPLCQKVIKMSVFVCKVYSLKHLEFQVTQHL